MVVDGSRAHFYEKKSKGYADASGWDLQKVDMGIALSHFWLTAQELGLDGRFVTSDPAVAVPKNTEYITSFEAAR